MLEKQISGKDMYETVKSIILDKAKMAEMGANAKKMAVTDGTEKIFKEILRLYDESQRA